MEQEGFLIYKAQQLKHIKTQLAHSTARLTEQAALNKHL